MWSKGSMMSPRGSVSFCLSHLPSLQVAWSRGCFASGFQYGCHSSGVHLLLCSCMAENKASLSSIPFRSPRSVELDRLRPGGTIGTLKIPEWKIGSAREKGKMDTWEDGHLRKMSAKSPYISGSNLMFITLSQGWHSYYPHLQRRKWRRYREAK